VNQQDPAVIVVPADFEQAVASVEAWLGAPRYPLVGGWGDGGQRIATAGYAFDVASDRIYDALDALFEPVRAAGHYLFIREHRASVAGDPDVLAILPTGDPDEVLLLMATDAGDRSTEDIIRWLARLRREASFVLTGAGFDFIEGRLSPPFADAAHLAERLAAFCPAAIEGDIASIDELTEALESATEPYPLYLWWD
jgi:hypothetical protein